MFAGHSSAYVALISPTSFIKNFFLLLFSGSSERLQGSVLDSGELLFFPLVKHALG